MNLETRANDGKTNETVVVGRIGFDIGASNHRTGRGTCGYDDMNVRCRGRGRRIGVNVVPAYAEIARRFVEQECCLEVAQRRKNRGSRTRVQLKVDVLSALIKQREHLNFAIGRIHRHDVAIGLGDRRPRWSSREQQRKNRNCSLEFFHRSSGPLRACGIKIYISSSA